jgi:hypothetical protein
MNLSRRTLTVGALFAAAGGLPMMVKAEGTKTVALLFDSLVSPFWVSGLDIMRVKAKEKGWTTLENISNFDDNKQFEQVKAMIARKVDGILIIQTDAKAVIPAIRAANAANIPMVHFNRPPAKSDAYSVAIQADNRKIMADTVTFLVDEARKSGGKYKACILIGDLGDVNAIQRRDGFFDVVNKNKDIIEVVGRVATEWNADKAFAGLTNVVGLPASADRAGAEVGQQVAQARRTRPRHVRGFRWRRGRLCPVAGRLSRCLRRAEPRPGSGHGVQGVRRPVGRQQAREAAARSWLRHHPGHADGKARRDVGLHRLEEDAEGVWRSAPPVAPAAPIARASR